MPVGYNTAQTPTVAAVPAPADPYTGTTYTPESGSDRLVLVVVGMGNASGSGVSTVCTLGGQALTKIGTVVTDSAWVSLDIWYLNEAGIGLMSGNTLSITSGVAHYGLILCTLTGVHQETPISGEQTGAGSGTTPAPSAGVSSTADGLVFAAVMSDQQAGYTGHSHNDDSGQLYSGIVNDDTYAAAQFTAGTGGSITPTWTQTTEGYAVKAFNVNASGGSGEPPLVVGHIGEAVIGGSTF